MIWFGIFVSVAAVLASISIWAPRPLRWKICAVSLTAVLGFTSYASLTDLLGRPKPAKMEWAAATLPEATVVATDLQEPDAIYLWLRFDEQLSPRAYALPWSLGTARQLQEMMQAAERNGTVVRMKQRLANSLDSNEPLFYVAPHQALPPKTPS